MPLNDRLNTSRLAAQQISAHQFTRAEELVAWMGAVQAQDYHGTKWALGARLESVREREIESPISGGTILRTHAMRGTWQLIAPADVRWLLALVGPRVLVKAASRMRELELDDRTLAQAHKILEKTLRDGAHATRDQLARALHERGVAPDGQRLSHVLAHAELSGLLVNGARRGKQSTHTLLELRAPKAKRPFDREEAVAMLVQRYFKSRGPATLEDFVWWSGLTMFDAKLGVEANKRTLASEVIDGKIHWSDAAARTAASGRVAYLLPPFDEYLIAYKDRDSMLNAEHTKHLMNMLAPIVVVRGKVAGIWRRTLGKEEVELEVELFDEVSRSTQAKVLAAAKDYAKFLELKVREIKI